MKTITTYGPQSNPDHEYLLDIEIGQPTKAEKRKKTLDDFKGQLSKVPQSILEQELDHYQAEAEKLDDFAETFSCAYDRWAVEEQATKARRMAESLREELLKRLEAQ